MVLKYNVGRTHVWFCGIIVLGSLVVTSAAVAQTNQTPEVPFIGFRPFGGSAQTAITPVASGSNTRSQSTRPTTITPAQPASAYPYPASSRPGLGAVSSIQSGTAERASLGGRLPSASTPTGGLNVVSGTTAAGGQAAGSVANVDPALWQRYQQEIKQQQAQQQSQQYQQWLAQQQQFLQQRQLSTVGFRAPQQTANRDAQSTIAAPTPAAPTPAAPTPAAPVPTAQPALATRANTQTTVARPITPRLNQAVVQQVSSTTTSNRDRSVARADFSSSVAARSTSTSAAANSTSVAKQATSAAKPQCCCVPQNCCVAAPARAPVTPAPVFRPQTVNQNFNQNFNQAANQVPTLSPSVPSTFGGFLGQAGANYQVQPQGGFQFQPGLGAPQFNSTGATGGGSWFSNVLTGTGAYTPLLPIVSAQGARIGQGIIGQPTAYIDGQPLRNLLRYIAP